MFVLIFNGCQNEIGDINFESGSLTNCKTDNSAIKTDAKNQLWMDQLLNIKKSPPEILIRSGINLIDYEVLDCIDSSTKEIHYKKTLLEDENMMPVYSDNFESIKAITRSEVEVLNSQKNQKYTFDNREKFIENLELIDANIIKLKWNNNGIETSTLCLVSDRKGIIYENFISNVLIIKKPTITTYINGIKQFNLKNDISFNADTSNQEGPVRSLEWELRAQNDWIWGANRGEAVIRHTAYYDYRGIFEYHNFSASHHFQLGNSDAQVREITPTTIAYGYAFSTPTINISLRFEMDNYSLSFGMGIGSKSGSTGQHRH